MNRPILASSLALTLLACGAIEPPTSARWPDAPAAPISTHAEPQTFAIDSLSFGDESRQGWTTIGFDLDHKATTDTSTDVCTRIPGALAPMQRDGALGIDNSFGNNDAGLLRVLSNDSRTLSEAMTDSIRKGAFTLQIQVTGLDGSPAQTNLGISTQWFASTVFDPGGAAPTFAPTESWPVRADLLDPDAGPFASKYRVRDGYVVDGTFVSGFGELILGAVFMGEPIDLHLRSAIVVGKVEGDTMTGTLAGAIDTAEFVVAATHLAGRVNPGQLCGSEVEYIASSLSSSSDILLDGSNEPGKTCDAISLGVKFTARRIANPTHAAPPDVRPACTRGK